MREKNTERAYKKPEENWDYEVVFGDQVSTAFLLIECWKLISTIKF